MGEKMDKYYSLKDIQKKKDIENKEPSIYIITSNRSAGKTTAVLIELLEKYKNNNEKFVLIYRYRYELSSSNEVFSDVLRLYPEYGKEMITVSKAHGFFYELRLDENVCGYALALSNIDGLKKYSPLFADVVNCLFDEFQKEDNKYLPDEFNKLQSLLITIGRGGGSMARDLKLYMLGNNVSVLNPYFINFGIHKRLKNETRFMRGVGWVAEFGYNENATKEMKKTGIYRAFNNTAYMEYMSENRYLLDNYSFVRTPKGKNKYIATIKKNGKMFGLLDFYEDNIFYVTTKVDVSCRNILAFNPNEHGNNTVLLKRSGYTIHLLKDAFYSGCLFFQDLECKDIIFDILSIDKLQQ